MRDYDTSLLFPAIVLGIVAIKLLVDFLDSLLWPRDEEAQRKRAEEAQGATEDRSSDPTENLSNTSS